MTNGETQNDNEALAAVAAACHQPGETTVNSPNEAKEYRVALTQHAWRN